MTKAIIKETDDVRVVWWMPDPIYPYMLEVKDRVKGWVPLMIYDSPTEALAGMSAIIESNRKEAES